MQPLKLTIHGLHSFKDTVEVDLAELGQHGLFGIFGPTGSGKSSLLDAMTLALYGQIDRLVGRSRRGIVNHHTDRLEVRLSFRCGDQVWEVQRAYRKDADGIAQRVHSRLFQQGVLAAEVVADKEREVNARIEALLGLNAEDFMRAVVLPQGRFMQFLHLQGSDRRRMLQRLFRLEAYGEELRGRVKHEASLVDLALNRIHGELAGLGEAGASSIEVAQEAVDQAQAHSSACHKGLQEAETHWRLARRAREHQAALGSAEGALAAHLQLEAEMEASALAVRNARRARPVLAAHERLLLATATLEATQAQATELNERLEQTREQERTLSEAWREAAETRSREEPGLEQRREALTRGVALEVELTEVTTTLGELEVRRGQLARRQSKDELALQELERTLEQRTTERTELAGQVAEQTVPQALREQIFGAHEHKRTLEAARERAAELKAALDATRKRLTEASTGMEQAQQAVTLGEARRARVARWAEHLQQVQDELTPLTRAANTVRERGLVARMKDAEDRVEAALQREKASRLELEEARVQLEHVSARQLRARMAGVLAQGLEHACPVCGSEDHPSPAEVHDEHALFEVFAQHAGQQARVQTAEASVGSTATEVRQAEADVESLRSQVPSSIPADSIEALQHLLEREDQARRTLTRGLERARHTVASLAPDLEQVHKLLAGAAAQRASLEDQERREQKELDAALHTEGTAWGALQATLGTLTLFDLPRLMKQTQDRDRQRELLAPRLAAAEKALQQADERFDHKRTAVQERRTELEHCSREHLRLSELRERLLERLTSILPTGSAREALEQVVERLAQLARAVHQTHQGLESARQQLLEITAHRASATGRLEAARSSHQTASTELAKALSTHHLDAVPPSDAGLPDADLDALDAAYQTWSARRGALQLTVDRLRAVDLPPVEETAFAAAEAAWEGARTAARDAEDLRSRALERLEQLRARAARFAELHAEDTRLGLRASQLEQLTRLLRGDRFVEYVANDYLADLVRDATGHLALLTRGRYALDLDEQGGFLVADLDAGGALRPAHSLSGGETFLTSLALALALSTQVQRHNAQALEFFFLDEGFGSLDPESLDRVMTAIERLSSEHRVIGLISHIAAVKERVPRYLELSNPRDASGTKVTYREA